MAVSILDRFSVKRYREMSPVGRAVCAGMPGAEVTITPLAITSICRPDDHRGAVVCHLLTTTCHGGEVRAPGLTLILLGVVAFAMPAYPQYFVAVPLTDFEWHVTAAGMFLGGAILLWLTRSA